MKLDLRHEVTINGITGKVNPRTDARVKRVIDASEAYSDSIDALDNKGGKEANDLRHEYYADLWDLLIDSEERPDVTNEHFEYDMLIALRDFFLGLRQI